MKLNLRKQKILSELKFGETIRLPEYCERLTISERQGRRDLGDLVDGGWLEREGKATARRRYSDARRKSGNRPNPAKPG